MQQTNTIKPFGIFRTVPLSRIIYFNLLLQLLVYTPAGNWLFIARGVGMESLFMFVVNMAWITVFYLGLVVVMLARGNLHDLASTIGYRMGGRVAASILTASVKGFAYLGFIAASIGCFMTLAERPVTFLINTGSTSLLDIVAMSIYLSAPVWMLWRIYSDARSAIQN